MKSTAAGSRGKSVDVDAVDENDDDDDDDDDDANDDDDDNNDDNDDDVGGVDFANTFPNSVALNAFGHRVLLATIGVHVRATKVSYGGGTSDGGANTCESARFL